MWESCFFWLWDLNFEWTLRQFLFGWWWCWWCSWWWWWWWWWFFILVCLFELLRMLDDWDMSFACLNMSPLDQIFPLVCRMWLSGSQWLAAPTSVGGTEGHQGVRVSEQRWLRWSHDIIFWYLFNSWIEFNYLTQPPMVPDFMILCQLFLHRTVWEQETMNTQLNFYLKVASWWFQTNMSHLEPHMWLCRWFMNITNLFLT